MVNDAEKFKAEDDKQKERISAKNGLESYCFNMKTTLDDEKVKDKISEDDKKAISDKCDEAIKWLDANQLAEVEEKFEVTRDDLLEEFVVGEGIVKKIVKSVFQLEQVLDVGDCVSLLALLIRSRRHQSLPLLNTRSP